LSSLQKDALVEMPTGSEQRIVFATEATDGFDKRVYWRRGSCGNTVLFLNTVQDGFGQ